MLTYVHAFWNHIVVVSYGGVLTEIDVTPEVDFIFRQPENKSSTFILKIYQHANCITLSSLYMFYADNLIQKFVLLLKPAKSISIYTLHHHIRANNHTIISLKQLWPRNDNIYYANN